MKSLFALSLTLAAASQAYAGWVHVATCSDSAIAQSVTTGQIPWRAGSTELGMVENRIALLFYGVPVAINREETGDALMFFCDGRYGLHPSYGGWRYLDARPKNPGYQLWLEDTSPRIQIRLNGNFVQEYSWTNKQTWDPHNQLFGNNFWGRLSNLGSNTNIYVVDTGVLDLSNTIVAGRVGTHHVAGWCNDPNSWQYYVCRDPKMHGTGIAKALKDPHIGMVRGARIYDANAFNPYFAKADPLDVFFALRNVFNHVNSGQKIISFAMTTPIVDLRRRVYCVAQWAYYSGIAMVLAAGNNSESNESNTPYAIVVGSSQLSTSGTRNKDMFGQLLTTDFTGTSASTAYAVAALSAIASRPGFTVGNVDGLYKAVRGFGNWNIMGQSAGWSGTPEHGHDHCSPIGLPKRSINWDAMIQNIRDLQSRYLYNADFSFTQVTDRTTTSSRTMTPSTKVTTTF